MLIPKLPKFNKLGRFALVKSGTAVVGVDDIGLFLSGWDIGATGARNAFSRFDFLVAREWERWFSPVGFPLLTEHF